MHYMTDTPEVEAPTLQPTEAEQINWAQERETERHEHIRRWAVEQARSMVSTTYGTGPQDRANMILKIAAELEAYVIGSDQ